MSNNIYEFSVGVANSNSYRYLVEECIPSYSIVGLGEEEEEGYCITKLACCVYQTQPEC